MKSPACLQPKLFFLLLIHSLLTKSYLKNCSLTVICEGKLARKGDGYIVTHAFQALWAQRIMPYQSKRLFYPLLLTPKWLNTYVWHCMLKILIFKFRNTKMHKHEFLWISKFLGQTYKSTHKIMAKAFIH